MTHETTGGRRFSRTVRFLGFLAAAVPTLCVFLSWTRADFPAICENCGRPYTFKGALPGDKGGKSGGGAGTPRMGFCTDCVNPNPCAQAEEQAANLRRRFNQVAAALRELRRQGPTAANYAAREKSLLDEAADLENRWRDLQARCDILGRIGDPGDPVRGKPDPDRERENARERARDHDRMAETLDRLADETELTGSLGEAIWAAFSEVVPWDFVETGADIADDYVFGVRQGHQDLADGYRQMADEHRDSAKTAADALAQPITEKKQVPIKAISRMRVEPKKVTSGKANTKYQKLLEEVREAQEHARAHQEAHRMALKWHYVLKKANNFEAYQLSHAANVAYHSHRVLHFNRQAAVKWHEVQLVRQKVLDDQLAKLGEKGLSLNTEWAKTHARIKEKGLSDSLTTALRKAGATDKQLEKLRTAVIALDGDKLAAAVAVQKARLERTEALRQALTAQGSKAPAVEPVGIRALEQQERFAHEFYRRFLNPGPKVEPK